MPSLTAPALLFLVVGAEEAAGVEPREATGEPPPEVERLIRHLKRVTPFNAAIKQGELSFFWAPVSTVAPEGISAGWVLSQLRGAYLSGYMQPVDVLTDRERLPYAPSRALLPVVIHPDLGEYAGDSAAVGPLPYYVAIDAPRATVFRAGAEALFVARCLGKVLGLGEESIDAELLSAPDFWGRSFPNLWFDTKGVPSETPPWPEPYASAPVEGGFGSEDWANAGMTVWRPDQNCLMGHGDQFCGVCTDHLVRVLLGSDPEVTFEPPLTLTDDVFGAVAAPIRDGATKTLWSGLVPRRTVHGQVVEPELETEISEDGRVGDVRYGDGLVLRTALVEHRTPLGRTITVSFDASQDGIPTPPGELSASGPADPEISASTPDLESTVPAEIVDSVSAFRWHVDEPVWKGPDGRTEHLYLSVVGLEDFHATLQAISDGLMTREEVERAVTDWVDWWWVDPSEEPPDSPKTRALRVPEDPEEAEPTVGATGMELAWYGAGGVTMWPDRLQGEGAPALSMLLARRVPVYESPDAGAVLGALAYVQCTGVSDVWRHGVQTYDDWKYWPREDASQGTRFGSLLDNTGRTVLTLRWADCPIPQHLDRLHRILADDADAPLSYPPPATAEDPEALRKRLRTSLVYDARAAEDGQTLRAALWWIHVLPPGTADLFGVVAEAYGRVLRILAHWAVNDDIATLLENYPGADGFQADLLATNSWHPGWKAFVARVRALLGDHIGIALSLSERVHTFYSDLDAVSRAARALGPEQLDELRTPTGVDRVYTLTASVTAGLFFSDTAAELELAQDIVNVAAFTAADTGFATLADGAADLWEQAARRYLAAAPSSPVPALRLLAETPPSWRERFLAAVHPSNADAISAWAHAAGLNDALLLADLVRRTLGAITDAVWGDALKVFEAAGALVKARETVVETCQTLLDDLQAEGAPDAATVAEVEEQLSRAVAMRDATVAILHSEAVLDAVNVASFASDASARRAATLAALGASQLEHHVQRLIAIHAHGPLLAAFAALPAEHMEGVRTHEVFVAHLQTEDLPDHFDAVLQAVKAITDDENDLDALVEIAAHRAYELAERSDDFDVALDASGVDRAVAALFKAAAAVGDRRSALAGHPVYSQAIDDLEGVYPFTLPSFSSWSLSDIAGGGDLATLSRTASIRVFADDEKIWLPETYAQHLALAIPARPAQAIDGITADGHTQMRFALALSKDADHLPDLVGRDTLLADHAEIVDLIDRSVSRGSIDEESAESIRDVLYQSPRADLDSDDPSTRAHEELETRACVARVNRVARGRGGLGYVITDAFSNAGPEFDETLTRFQVHLAQRAGGVLAASPQAIYARTLRLAADARTLGNAYVDARREVASIATIAAATAAGVAISVVSGGAGAPLAATMIYAAIGAGAASMITRQVIEGPAYVSQSEASADFASGAVDGLIDGATGGLIKGTALGVRGLTAGSRGLAGRTANTMARALVEGERTSRPFLQVGRPMVLGMLEGVGGGAVSAVLQTAMDEATWDQSQRRVWWKLIESALFGAGFGGVFGVVGGSVGSLFEAIGEAGQRGRMYGWLLDTNELGLINDLPHTEWPKLAEARAKLDAGDIDGARTIMEDVRGGPEDLVDRLLEPLIERGRVPLSQALDELEDLRVTLDTIVGDPLGDAEFVAVASASLREEARGGAEIHVVERPGQPPKITVMVDEAADAKILREELLHVAEVLYDNPRSQSWWRQLTDDNLAAWSTMSPADQLAKREAYLELEAINGQQVIDTYGPKRADLDEDQLFSLASAEAHLEEDMAELTRVRKAKDDLAAGLPANTADIDLDDAPFLTARRKKPPTLWKEITGDPALVPQIKASFDRLVARLGTDVTASTKIRSGWRKRVRIGSDEVDVVQLGGVVRMTRADVTGDPAAGIAGAAYGDLPGWSDLRSQLQDDLLAAVAQAAPSLGPSEADAVVERMLDRMEQSPLGFVYGTTPLRVFDYAAAYKANAAAAGPFRSAVEDLHHLTPLYLLGTGQLHLEEIAGIDGKIAAKLVDLDKDTHARIHELMNQLLIFPVDGPTEGIATSPHALRKHLMSRLKPAAAMIDADGDMTFYTWDATTSGFEELTLP